MSAYQVDYWPGIAVAVIENDGERAKVVMIGDDKVHDVLSEYLTEIGETDFCAECGQIGCTHDGRERGDEI